MNETEKEKLPKTNAAPERPNEQDQSGGLSLEEAQALWEEVKQTEGQAPPREAKPTEKKEGPLWRKLVMNISMKGDWSDLKSIEALREVGSDQWQKFCQFAYEELATLTAEEIEMLVAEDCPEVPSEYSFPLLPEEYELPDLPEKLKKLDQEDILQIMKLLLHQMYGMASDHVELTE